MAHSRLRSRKFITATSLAVALLLAFLLTAPQRQAIGQEERAVSASSVVGVAVELAPFMGELQRLTHKLSLAIVHANYELAEFYLYESLESMNDIKEQVPEYRGLPIALLIDQISGPKYDRLKSALRSGRESKDNERAVAALNEVIGSCNQCHLTTGHGFIKITNRGDFNPFNQDFVP